MIEKYISQFFGQFLKQEKLVYSMIEILKKKEKIICQAQKHFVTHSE